MPGFFKRNTAEQPMQRLAEDRLPAAVYAIGDVHGCLAELEQLEQLIAVDLAGRGIANALIVMLGDYIDRGPASAAVLDHLVAAPSPGFRRVCLSGNHELMMRNFLANPQENNSWLLNGGTETLASYGIDPHTLFSGGRRRTTEILASHIPADHLEFLQTLPALLTLPGFVFVHAGLRLGVPLEQQSERDMLWMRHEQAPYPLQPFGMVVHGHTPAVKPVVELGRICVDTGAYATGVLSALSIDGSTKGRILQTHPSAKNTG